MSAISDQHRRWYEANARLMAGIAVGQFPPNPPIPAEIVGPRERDWLLVGNVWMGDECDYRVDDSGVPPKKPVWRRTVAFDPSWTSILLQVAHKHHVTPRDIKSARRDRHVVAARHEVMFRLKAETLMSLPAIGKRLNRDHSTVIHGVRKHAERMVSE